MAKTKDSLFPDSVIGGGPKGLGDPDDKTLRQVETQVLIPQIMRDRMRKEKCYDLAEEFQQCAKKHGLLVVVKCREANRVMQNCMKSWYENPEFRAECTEEYLRRRSEFRRTGEGQKIKAMKKIVT